MSSLWRVAALLAVAVFAGQVLWTTTRGPGPAVHLAGAEDGPGLIVGFSPEATEVELRNLLLDLDLVIIGGPSALGLYKLAPGASTNLAEAAAALSTATSLVDSVKGAGE